MQTDVHTKKEKRQRVKSGKPFGYESRLLKIKNLGPVGEGCARGKGLSIAYAVLEHNWI